MGEARPARLPQAALPSTLGRFSLKFRPLVPTWLQLRAPAAATHRFCPGSRLRLLLLGSPITSFVWPPGLRGHRTSPLSSSLAPQARAPASSLSSFAAPAGRHRGPGRPPRSCSPPPAPAALGLRGKVSRPPGGTGPTQPAAHSRPSLRTSHRAGGQGGSPTPRRRAQPRSDPRPTREALGSSSRSEDQPSPAWPSRPSLHPAPAGAKRRSQKRGVSTWGRKAP